MSVDLDAGYSAWSRARTPEERARAAAQIAAGVGAIIQGPSDSAEPATVQEQPEPDGLVEPDVEGDA